METQRLFTYQAEGNIDKHKVIHAEPEEAEALIESGKAVKLDLPELNAFERKANEIHANYKKEVERIKASDNPLMTDEVKAYEIDKLDKQMREQSAKVEADYKAWKQAQIDEAKVRAARAVVKVAEDDREVAEQFVTRASLKLASAIGDTEKSAVVNDIINDIAHLTDAEKTAMQSKISALLSELDATDKHKLVSAVQNIRNSDLLAVKVAEQLPHSVLTQQRIHDLAKQVVAESTFSQAQGGIDRDFYEKHLKGKGAFMNG
ncbi:hypothetical protein ACFFIS_04740 [Virgibacillus soli]|uniref:DUF4355 domain-containing protein n=1 Tax=Paracerasibacillus soli TaxID=480284 RepID=A0ABU5CUB9_9BACI|nr:hypothetical protein [Virgibacillus soli]MDY0409968.1 hypothetical protein [Virgibacillus soli]